VTDLRTDSESDLRNGLPERTPTYGTYGTDGESGYERADLSEPNAHASTSPRSLAYLTPCRYCGTEVYVAICRDGRWRTFDTRRVPAAERCVWAWRKRLGMEEQDLVPGHLLHYCAERGLVQFAVGAIR
jgi:hypothetical protein